MENPKKGPETLKDAIDQLESIGQSTSRDIVERLSADYKQVESVVEEILPQLDDLKQKAEQKAKETKDDLEEKMKKNPWVILGVVGLIALIIGFFIGSDKRKK